jgi:flagellar basal body-associated protein FliL
MFKNIIHWKQYLPYAFAASVAYCIPVVFFIRDASYTQTWLLYIGNFLFLFIIAAFLFSFNRKRKQNAGTVAMVTAGHIVTVMGIILAVLLSTILMMLLIPGFFDAGMADKVMDDAPANNIKGKTNGLVFEIIVDAIVGNVSAGSFASILFPFALKGDQTREEVPKQQKEL